MTEMSMSPSRSQESSVKSFHSVDDEIHILRSNSSIERLRTNGSELSRIWSGIRDDRIQDMQEQHEQHEPEQILVSQLDLISRHTSRTDSHSVLDEENADSDEEASLEILDPPPDGGVGWVMAICAMFIVFATWGSNASYGVYLNHYLTSGEFQGATEYDFALIGGLVIFLAQFLAPFSALAYKVFGFYTITLTGIVVQTAGYILASFATKIWQLYLTQGVLIGISFVLLFIPATLVLPTWFDKRLATCMGITVAGAGLGGLVFSLSVEKVIRETGNQRWALRMCGFVTLAVSLVSISILKPRNYKPLPYSTTLTKKFLKDNFKTVFDISVFNNYAMIALGLWFAIVLLGYVLILFSIASYGTLIGLLSSQSSVLTSTLNAAQTVGRPLMGLGADSFGRANLAAGISFSICILIFAFWINALTYATLLPFSILVGLVVGVGSSFAQSLAAILVSDNLEQLPAAWSGLNIMVSVACLVAEVIALALRRKTGTRRYLHTQIFAGCCFFAGTIFVLVVREWIVRRTFKRRLEASLQGLADTEKKGGTYLRAEDLNKDQSVDIAILQDRIDRYERLLKPRIWAFVVRMFYPINV